jgi:hypothetical protein
MANKKTETVKPEFDFRQLKSFEDFCKARNIDPTQLPGVDNLPEELRAPLISAYRLMVAISAVNEGKKSDYTNDEPKWFPWARVLSSGSGFGFSDSAYRYGYRYSDVGSRLSTDDSEKSEHVFEVMQEDYKTWLI